MNFSVLAISGKAKSGKTEIYNILKTLIKDKYPEYRLIRRSFAAKLKDIAEDLFGWDGSKEIYYNQTSVFSVCGAFEQINKPIQDQGRPLLINIGTLMKTIRPTVWADYVFKSILKDIENNEANNKIYVIDDLRYLDELPIINKFGNKLFKLRLERNQSLKLNDLSETDLDNYYDWDMKIQNNFDLNHLYDYSEKLLDQLVIKSRLGVHSNDLCK